MRRREEGDRTVTETEAPRALFVYFSFSQRTRRVADTMADTLRRRGYEVTEAAIEFTDQHYGKKFSKRPMSWSIAEDLQHAARAAAQEDRGHRGPTGGVRRRLRPGGHRLTYVVADDLHADPLLHARSLVGSGARREAVRGVLDVSPLLQEQPEDDPRAGHEERREVRGRHPLRLRRQPGDVDVVVARVHAPRRREAAFVRRATCPSPTSRTGSKSRRRRSSTAWPTRCRPERSDGHGLASEAARYLVAQSGAGRFASCETAMSFR